MIYLLYGNERTMILNRIKKIRKELFKAVNKLSNGKILVKEYLISPKAVSR